MINRVLAISALGLLLGNAAIAADEAPAYFGWLAMFADYDLPASSAQTRKKLSWEPTGPGLIADLERLQVPDR